jgi:hypothetical protein
VNGEHDQVDGELRISNEFTSVILRKVLTRNGEVLEISSAQVDRTVRLDALVLESLTWRSEEELSKGLETPFGADVPDVSGTSGASEGGAE